MKNILVAGLALAATSSWSQALSRANIVCDNPIYEFGDRDNSEKVTHTFVIRNAGSDPLVITGVKPACGCTVANIGKKELAPGEHTEVKASLNLSGRRGAQVKTIAIRSNGSTRPFQLTMRGTAVTDIAVAPQYLIFGNLNVGHTKEMTVTVKATRGKPFAIKGVEVLRKEVTAEVTTVKEGFQYAIQVRLPEGMKEGRFSDSLRIVTDHPSLTYLTVPVSGNVVGPVAVLPNTLYFIDNGRPLTRFITVTPGTAKSVKVTKVEWPGVGDHSIKVLEQMNNGVRIELKNVVPDASVNGKNLLIHTTVPGREVIKVPISIRSTSGRPVGG